MRNNKSIRAAAALLAVLTAGSVLLASCGEASSAPADTEPVEVLETEPVIETETEIVYRADLPENLDYGGAAFNIYTYDDANSTWYDVDFAATGENGELLNDATFRRMVEVEQLLNIDIVPNPGPTNGSKLKKTVAAGDGAFDIAFVQTRDAASIAQAGYLLDLKNIDTLDLSQPWWDQNAVADLSIGGRLFMVTGDLSIMYKKTIGVLLVNKPLLNENDLENPYELVQNKKWTIDKFIEMGKTVSADLNGDGKFDKEDKYGLLFYRDMIALGLIGAGVQFCSKDADDYPVDTFYTDRTQAAWEKYTELMFDPQLALSWSKIGVPNEDIMAMFQNNQGLFNFNEFHSIESMRQMNADFGILPVPLFEEAQDSYHHIINPYVAAMLLVPKDCPDTERVGYVLDALGASSKNILTPAYYDQYLKTKGARDDDSEAMLDIIFSTLHYDTGYLYDFGTIGAFTLTMVDAYKPDLASAYAKISDKVKTAIDKMVTAYREID